jgi:hypothetical protein
MVLTKCGEVQDLMHFNQLLLPYPGDCSRFCQCDLSQALRHFCPVGLHFNADIQSCDWPHMARCSITRTLAFYF